MNWVYPAFAVLTVLGFVKLVQWNRRRLVSDAWLAENDRAESIRGWDREVPWQGGKLDYETWKPGR